MGRGRRTWACLLVALVGLMLPAVAAAAGGRGRTPRSLTIDLPLRAHARALDRFARAVSTPGSPLYGDYASVPELVRRFGASPATRRRVVRWLRAHGATRVTIDPTGLFAEATVRATAAQRLFATRLTLVHAQATRAHPAQTFAAPASRVRVPRALRGAVTGVVGLSTEPLSGIAPQHASGARSESVSGVRRLSVGADGTVRANATSAYSTRTGTAAGCAAALAGPGFTPNQYLTAYGYDPLHAEGLEGQGETVALIEIDGFRTSDIQAFASCFGLAMPHVNAYGVGIGTALAPGAEATLDLELLDAAAPDLSSVDVYESEPVASQVLRSLTAPLGAKSEPDVISASLGTCEADAQVALGSAGLATVEQELQLAAAAGITVLAASGDHGSTACLGSPGKPLDKLAVDYPASSPWVTGVGGTNVDLSAANTIATPATDQVVWNDEPAAAGAGGGGVSSMFTRPSYQNGVQSSTMREVPDVSMLADPLPGYEVYCTATPDCLTTAGANPWMTLGGTSAGTPLLAGGVALIDQELRSRGQQTIGFANPLLYRIASSSAAALTLSDVVSGSNDLSGALFGQALGCCSATTGYDDASGLGSVNLAGLATAAATLVGRQVTVSLLLPRQTAPARAGHLLATVSCSGVCRMGAYARISLGVAGRITIYSRPYQLTVRRSRTIRIGLSARTRRRITSALAAHRAVTATIYGAIINAGGNVVRQTAGRTLRIRA